MLSQPDMLRTVGTGPMSELVGSSAQPIVATVAATGATNAAAIATTARRPVGARALLGLVSFYQRHLSGAKARPTCRYLPTCSEYARLSIERRGALMGTLYAIGRIVRCNPLFHAGYHGAPNALPSGAAASSSSGAGSSGE